MTDTAALANEAEATLENALGAIADPHVAAAAQETFVSAASAMRQVQDALGTAAAELRTAAAHRDPAAAHDLRQLAERLEAPGAWETVDRIVHELMSDLVAGALAVADDGASATLAARAVAIRVLSRSDALWTGAGPRMGCAYGYDSLLAIARTTAVARAARPA